MHAQAHTDKLIQADGHKFNAVFSYSGLSLLRNPKSAELKVDKNSVI